jgi:hypothetical protein
VIRLGLSLCVHLLLRWNARENVIAQRQAAAHSAADAMAYRAGIPHAEAIARHLERRVIELRQELRARKLARLFGGNA